MAIKYGGQPQSFEEMMGLEKGPGEIPSGTQFNDYIAQRPLTREQQSEKGTLDAMDARTDASFAADLAQAKAVGNARNSGFESPRSQEEYLFKREHNAKLEQARASGETALARMLLSNQLTTGRQAANADRIDAREVAGSGRTADRVSNNQMRADLLSRAHGMETPRPGGGYAAPDENVNWYNKGVPNMLAGWLGADNEQQIRTRDADKLRDQARALGHDDNETNLAPAPDQPDPGWTTLSSGARVRKTR